MSTDREPTNDLDGARVRVDDDAHCHADVHAWPASSVAGDRCQCGRYYLRPDADGEVHVERDARDDL